MLGVFAPAATYGRRDSTVAAHQRLAFTIPGDFVRILLSLPLIDANADEPVDLWTTPEAQPLQGLLGRQSCISRVLFSPCKQSGPSHTAEPGCPIPVYGRYRDVIHLGLRDSPDEYYPHWLARKLGLQAPSRGFRLRCIPPAGQSDISPKRKRGQQLLSSLTLRVNVECAILNRGRCHGERNGPSGAVVLDMPRVTSCGETWNSSVHERRISPQPSPVCGHRFPQPPTSSAWPGFLPARHCSSDDTRGGRASRSWQASPPSCSDGLKKSARFDSPFRRIENTFGKPIGFRATDYLIPYRS